MWFCDQLILNMMFSLVIANVVTRETFQPWYQSLISIGRTNYSLGRLNDLRLWILKGIYRFQNNIILLSRQDLFQRRPSTGFTVLYNNMLLSPELALLLFCSSVFEYQLKHEHTSFSSQNNKIRRKREPKSSVKTLGTQTSFPRCLQTFLK